ncbi:hypothetical protein HPP92_014029 [Vanilla planifolia]|uniref:DEK-C domain-containing protein n=1 Tax=Vanilla planifolia TaxID=51239 RepID=A0A835UX85_VANPL|nr:hypothetical protein HPP92_014029 [Vanilla planifolia]
MHEVQEVMDCEQKSEMETKINGETTKVNKIKDLMAMNMKVMNEDAAANERHEEKDNVRSVGYEEENAIEEDDVNRENDGNTENVSLKRKRSRERGNVEGKTKENTDAKEKRESEQNAKDLSISPLSTSRERPVRERKIVERLVEVIEKEPNRTVVIEKGRGTPLKDIPNVAYKLARKKPADLKFLHQTLFGRKGKAIDFKNNLLQFSGFAWHESEEKRRVKIKEKLDKCHKHALLDLANLLDLNVSKGSIKKEEVIVKLLDFMEAPSARTDIIIAEEQLSKSRKRKRDTKSNASKTSKGSPAENSMKKSAKTEDLVNSEEKISKDKENDDDDEVEKDTENGMPDEDDATKQSESDAKESESLEAEEKGDIEGGDSAKGETVIKNNTKQQSSGNPVVKKERSNSKLSAKLSAKSPVKKTSSKPSKVQKDDGSEKVFTRKKRNVESPKRSKPRQNPKDASSGKKEKSAMVEDRKSGPSKTDLRKTICEILKEVDFNTATFTDILKMLATHYKTDLTSRKPTIKQMIQEELTKMADEDEEGESGEEEDAVKEEATRPTGKKVKA